MTGEHVHEWRLEGYDLDGDSGVYMDCPWCRESWPDDEVEMARKLVLWPELATMLKRLEWQTLSYGKIEGDFCPVCHRSKALGHTIFCEMGELLRRIDNVLSGG